MIVRINALSRVVTIAKTMRLPTFYQSCQRQRRVFGAVSAPSGIATKNVLDSVQRK
jgi:hypothetical protein